MSIAFEVGLAIDAEFNAALECGLPLKKVSIPIAATPVPIVFVIDPSIKVSASVAGNDIPNTHLSEDITNGFGPEVFDETSAFGRQYRYAVCYWPNSEFTGATNVVLKLRHPDGSSTTQRASLSGPGATEEFGTSPTGGSEPALPAGWCGSGGSGGGGGDS